MKSGGRQPRYNFNPTDFCCISTGQWRRPRKKLAERKIKKYLASSGGYPADAQIQGTLSAESARVASGLPPPLLSLLRPQKRPAVPLTKLTRSKMSDGLIGLNAGKIYLSTLVGFGSPASCMCVLSEGSWYLSAGSEEYSARFWPAFCSWFSLI